MPYLTDEELTAEDPLDQMQLLAWELADRLDARAKAAGMGSEAAALKTVSEFVYRSVSQGMTDAESMAVQLENMARYCREHLS